MEYVIANKKKAVDFGFAENEHLVNGSIMCLNEKEVMISVSLTGTLSERASTLGGPIVDASRAKLMMSNSEF